MINTTLLSQRIKQIRRHLKRQKVDALLVTHPANVRYCTGFQGADSWVLIMPRSVVFLTDSRYTEQARQECCGCRILERKTTLSDLVAGLCRNNPTIQTIGVEDTISWQLYQTVKKAVKPKTKAISGCIETIRTVKDNYELTCIKKAIAIAKKALSIAWAELEPGMTEIQFTARLDYEMQRQGGSKAFDTIVAFGPNGSRPHHQPGRRKLRRRDSVLIDYGAAVQGYCSDMTRCLTVGSPTQLFQKAFAVVAQAQTAAIGEIRAGASLQHVDQAARAVIAVSNFPVYGHGSGHGFGLNIHEHPFLKPETNSCLEVGQVLTIEPGIYLPGQLGVRLEDDVLVTETGYQLLTRRQTQQHSYTALV